MRRALISLWRQFKRCSEQYPPLYCDRFSPRDYDTFKDSFSGWHEWHWQEGGGIYRFYGSPDGLPEFTSLAESACLVAQQGPFNLAAKGGIRDHLDWLSLLHQYAFTIPTPLLRGSRQVIDTDGAPVTEEKLKDPGKFSRQLFPPQYTKLAHSVFVSSMTLCEILVDPNRVLWLDKHNRIYEHETEEQAACEQPDVNLAPPLLQFSFDGVWHLRTEREKGRFPDAKGFAAYRKLVTQPGVGIRSEELLGLHGAVVSSAESSGAELLDLDGEKAIWQELELLEREANDTIAPDRQREIQDRQNELFDIVQKAKDRRGNRRTMPIIAHTLANRVHSQMRNVRTLIRKQMPKLAEHLKASVISQGGLFIYQSTR